MNSTTMWHLVYTKPKNEDLVASKLQSAGFEILNSKLRERRYVRRKLQNVVSSLFPCYIFAKFCNSYDYRLVNYTRGVRSIVGNGRSPAVVPDEIISAIRAREEQGVVTVRPQKFQPGEEVLIKGGPFQDVEAIFQMELKGMERVSILIKSINARMVLDGSVLTRN